MNRNYLLGTTALVAGGLLAADTAQAADPLRLEVRGFRNEYFGVVSVESDVDNENFNNTNHFSDGEVQFRGTTTLDNGILVGVRVELEAFTSGDQIDENYVFLEGGFGRLQLGSDDPAPYQQAIVAPNVGVPINSGWLSNFIPAPTGFTTGAFQTTPEISIDDNMVNYFSPRFAGFQLGLAYIPDLDEGGDGNNDAPFGNGEGNNTTAEDNDRHHGFGVGVNYSNSFNGIDLGVAGGYQVVGPPDETASNLAGTDDKQTVNAYNVGLNVGFGGFTLGGSWGGYDIDDQGANDGFHWDVGASYETGPGGLSATFIMGEREGDVAVDDEDESLAISAAVAYTLGPGIRTNVTALYADYDAEDGNDGEGFGAVLGLRVDF